MSKVRIGHLDYEIREMDKAYASDAYGLYLADPQEIHLVKGMSKGRHAEVLLHELLHGVVDHQNLQHTLGDLEEPVVHGIALGLATMIRDNQKLFLEIIAALK